MTDIFDTFDGDIFDTFDRESVIGTGTPLQPVPARDIFDTFDREPEPVTAPAGDIFDTFDREPEPAIVTDTPLPPEPEGRTFANIAKDIGIAALTGAIAVPEAAMGLLDIPTGGRAGKFAKKVLKFDPEAAKNILQEYYSDPQQKALQSVEDAEGFWNVLKTAVKNPSVIAQTAIESAPSMVAGGAIARGFKVAPWIAGAIGEGLVGAGLSAESIRQQTADELLTPGQSLAAVASGVGAGVFNIVGARLAKKFGFDDVDTLLAGGKVTVPKNIAKGIAGKTKDVGKRVVAGGISEGIFEEMPQEMQDQMWSNAALGRPLLDGVEKAAAMGALTGGAMGAGINVAAMGRPPLAPAPVEPLAPAAPMDEAVISKIGESLEAGKITPEDARALVKRPRMGHLAPQVENLIKATEVAPAEVAPEDTVIVDRILKAVKERDLTPEQVREIVKRPDMEHLAPQVENLIKAHEPVPEPVGAKQPWEMTGNEFEENYIFRGVGDDNYYGINAFYGTLGKARSFSKRRDIKNPKLRIANKKNIDKDLLWEDDTRVTADDILNKYGEIGTPIPELEIKPSYEIPKEGIENPHKYLIQKAIKEGKPVPPEVLKDYPDLAPEPMTPKENTKLREQVKDTIKAGLKGGSIEQNAPVRFTSVVELEDILKKGELTVGVDFEGQPGISAQRVYDDSVITAYGPNTQKPVAIVFPKSAVESKGQSVDEVKMKSTTKLQDLKFVVDGKLQTYEEVSGKPPEKIAEVPKPLASRVLPEGAPKVVEDVKKEPWGMVQEEYSKDIVSGRVIKKDEYRSKYLFTEDTPENIVDIVNGKSGHPKNLVYFQQGGLHHAHPETSIIVIDKSKLGVSKITSHGKQREATGEYLINAKDIRGALFNTYKNQYELREKGHKHFIEQAIEEGKIIPPEVLKEYPELKTKEITTPTPADKATVDKIAEVPKPKPDVEAMPVMDDDTQPAKPGVFEPIPRGLRRGNIIRVLSSKLSVPIRVGKFRQTAAGIYKILPKVIRLKKANYFKVVIHEVGHHIQETLGIKGVMPEEVKKMAYPGAKNKNREGFAEFLRFYITQPNKARKGAPGFYKTFEQALVGQPDIKNVLVKAKESWSAFQEASDVSKVHSFIVSGDIKKPHVTFDELYTEIKDNLYPIKKAVETAVKAGAKLADDADPYTLSRLARGWERKADQFLRHQPFRYVNNEAVFSGKSLRKILAKTEKVGERGLLDTYLLARRAMADSRVLEGFQGVLSKDNFANTVKELEPKFKQVAKELDEYNNILLDYLVDSGRIDTETAEAIRAKNSFYTPLYRVMDGGESGTGLGQKAGTPISPIKRLKGSSRDVYSPTESILKNTYSIINSAEKTQIGNALLGLTKVEGMGHLIEKVPFGMKPEKIRKDDFLKILSEYGETQKIIGIKTSEKELTKNLKNIPSSKKMETVAKEALMTRGWSDAEAGQVIRRIKESASGEVGGVVEKIVEKTTIKIIKEELGFSGMPDSVIATFRQDYKAGKNEVILYDKGKPVLVELDPFLYKAVANINAGEVNALIKFASYPAKWLRAGATTFSPEFGIRNPLRDQMTAFIQSRYGFIPGVDFLRGVSHMIGGTKLWQEFNASGAAHSAIVSMDSDYLSKNLKEMLGTDVKKISANPLKVMQRLSEIFEEATRVGEFVKARGKKAPLRTAGMAGREVSLDFMKLGGPSARAANLISAFWNARVEGLDKMARSFKEAPGRTAAKAFIGVTLPSLFLWLTQKDDEYYKELPAWRKTGFWNIRVNDSDGNFKMFIPIPKPFEWGLLFGSLPVAMLDWMYTKDKTMINDAAESVMKSLNLVPIPTGAAPIAEWWANKSWFFDRPVVPRDKGELEPYLQYGQRTSETMKLVGRMLKDIPGLKKVASPAKLENILKGYTAGAGRLALDGTDWLIETLGVVTPPPDTKMTISDIPGLRAFGVRFPSANAMSIERFYKDYLKEKRAWESKKEVAGVRGKGIEGLNKLNPKLWGMERTAKSLSTLRKIVRELHGSDMESGEKTKMQKDLYYSMINIARRHYGMPMIGREND